VVWQPCELLYTCYLLTYCVLSVIRKGGEYPTYTGLRSRLLLPFTCLDISLVLPVEGGSVAEWFACWTQAQKARVQIAVAALSDNSLRQTAHTHCASVHQAAKLVAALLRVAGVTASLGESNGSLPPGL